MDSHFGVEKGDQKPTRDEDLASIVGFNVTYDGCKTSQKTKNPETARPQGEHVYSVRRNVP